ncbi:MAG: twin-arginine translocation pathway signal protein [Chitinophagaceae bacterium]|nr:MAG: twin-arginine translocation pathway signal protein [Chitinophagaceae bacterium]
MRYPDSHSATDLRRLNLPRILFFILLLFGSLASAGQKANVIYLMVDDMGYADLSCYGRKDYQTPNLDELAAAGMKFMNAYAAAAVCTPTRVAFMTGRYPARVDIGLLEPWTGSKKDVGIGLSPAVHSLAKAVKTAGYETALIGKWHLGGDTAYAPRKHGFNYFYGIKSGGADYTSHRGATGEPDLYENETPVTASGYLTDLIGQKAIAFLNREHSKPFFLSLQFTAPHWPWQAPGDKPMPDSLFGNPVRLAINGSPAIFAAMMKSLDEQVGKIMQVLKERGLDQNTVVIFTSDNGGEKFSDMGPFTKGKMNVWEGGIRVPAFVVWPGKVASNVVSVQPVITMDWSATILAITGAKMDPAFPVDGINLVPYLEDKNRHISRTFYWRLTQRVNQHAVLDGNWKYLRDGDNEYLFDINLDPGEKNDLRKSESAKYILLKQKYFDWEKTMLPPKAL